MADWFLAPLSYRAITEEHTVYVIISHFRIPNVQPAFVLPLCPFHSPAITRTVSNHLAPRMAEYETMHPCSLMSIQLGVMSSRAVTLEQTVRHSRRVISTALRRDVHFGNYPTLSAAVWQKSRPPWRLREVPWLSVQLQAEDRCS